MSTIRLTVIDGVSHELEAPTDMNMNVMELCKSAELPVEGTCGGMAMCASCHCYVEEAASADLSEKSDDEEDMLDEAFHVTDDSRLGCQLHLKDDMDGMVIRLAPVG
jgi:ferredoxin